VRYELALKVALGDEAAHQVTDLDCASAARAYPPAAAGAAQAGTAGPVAARVLHLHRPPS
jgi:hypothetical protein